MNFILSVNGVLIITTALICSIFSQLVEYKYHCSRPTLLKFGMSGREEKKVSPRKLQIEHELKKMNDLLTVMIQKPDNTEVYQRNIIFFLRAVASIRERMLANESGCEDAEIKGEILELEKRASMCLVSTP